MLDVLSIMLDVLSVVWLISFITLMFLYQIDRFYWSKGKYPAINKSCNSTLLMLIPAFVGAPLFLISLLYELVQKGGFGRGKK
jgi:hypothetical protein